MKLKKIIHKMKGGVFFPLSTALIAILLIIFVVWTEQSGSVHLNLNKPNRITKDHIAKVLQTLPFQEKQDLDALFRCFFLRGGFAFTLFGERALAYTAYFKRVPLENIICGRIGPPVGSWWRTWEKYKCYFPIEKFDFISTEDHVHNTVCIYLINKKLYQEVLHLARPDSKWVLNSGKTLRELEDTFKEFKIQELPNYTEVLGVLLGFGENNSNLFYQREIMEQLLIPDNKILGKAAITGDLINLTEKLNQLDNKLQGVQTHDRRRDFEFLSPLGFVADINTEETKQVLSKFKKARSKIEAAYAEGNFLEVTLERLTALEEP